MQYESPMSSAERSFRERLRRAAEAAGFSWVEDSGGKPVQFGELPTGSLLEVLESALRLLGDDLLGVVLFGSWVRGEAGAESDLDVLLVLHPSFPLTRQLYRKWDQAEVRAKNRFVEVHFVHPPAERKRLSAFWAEVATDGLLLLDRGGRVSRALEEVRRRIAAGELVRREIGGRTYWVEAA
ncbi:MAG: hypothetical protein Kow00109_05730 [Acidobacteriota bacterium]